MTTLFPTQAYAQDSDMSLSEFEDFVFGACHVREQDGDPIAYWRGVQTEQQHIVDLLAGHDRVESAWAKHRPEALGQRPDIP